MAPLLPYYPSDDLNCLTFFKIMLLNRRFKQAYHQFNKSDENNYVVFIFIYIINKISILKATTTTLITINDYDSIFQPELKQPDPSILILEAHIHATPKPKVTWLCNGDFIKESERKHSKLEPRIGEKNKWTAILTIIVSWGYIYLYDFRVRHLCSMRF